MSTAKQDYEPELTDGQAFGHVAGFFSESCWSGQFQGCFDGGREKESPRTNLMNPRPKATERSGAAFGHPSSRDWLEPAFIAEAQPQNPLWHQPTQ